MISRVMNRPLKKSRVLPSLDSSLLISLFSVLLMSCGTREATIQETLKTIEIAPLDSSAESLKAGAFNVTRQSPREDRLKVFSRGLWQKKKKHDLPELAMAVFGDSLGAATFAGTKIGQQLSIHDIWNLLRILSLIYQNPPSEDERREKAANLLSYETFNGYSGMQPWSHRSRIAQALDLSVAHRNFAIPGAHTTELERQVSRFEDAYMYSPFMPSYVVFSIGGNDFCDSYPADRAAENLEIAIRRLRQTAPQALVLISGIPDVVGVYRNYDRLAFRVGPYTLSCRQRVELYGLCARERAILNGSEADLALAKQDQLEYQRRFASLAATQNENYPSEGPVVYAPVPPIPEDTDVLAADCFHPGVEGHHMIAESTWPAVERAFLNR